MAEQETENNARDAGIPEHGEEHFHIIALHELPQSQTHYQQDETIAHISEDQPEEYGEHDGDE